MEEIEKKLKSTFSPFIEGLKIYTEDEFFYKESEEIWSLAQMYEHITGTGFAYFLANINRCLEQRKGQIGGELTDAGSYVLYKNGFPPDKKFKRPDTETVPVIIPKTIAHYALELPKLLEELLAVIPKVEKDSGEYKTFHFYFGMLNANQWLLNTEFHFRHHLIQKAELETYYAASGEL